MYGRSRACFYRNLQTGTLAIFTEYLLIIRLYAADESGRMTNNRNRS